MIGNTIGRWKFVRRDDDQSLRDIPQDLLEFAHYNTTFATWLSQVRDLCMRFLADDLLELVEHGQLEPWDAWNSGCSHASYFTDVILGYLDSEQGEDFVAETIGQEAMWGAATAPP